MNWPARSPDLNPIEHLWDIVGRKIRNLQQPPATLPELRLKLTQVWEEFEQEEVRNVIDSMPRRMRAVINARGGNTSY
jgi:transposase